jgi:hypothetical protein
MYAKNDAGVYVQLHLVIIYWRSLLWKAIEKEELGKDDITDFLTVSFSTDYVGHY